MKDDSLAMMANVDGKTTRHCIGYKCSPSAAVQKAENMISRDFSAEAPNWKWLTDITQIPSDGKLYIAPVLDCFNGEIVGLAMDGNMKKELCIRAFDSACRSRNTRGMILYSDRGRVYQLWIPEMQSFVVPKTDR